MARRLLIVVLALVAAVLLILFVFPRVDQLLNDPVLGTVWPLER